MIAKFPLQSTQPQFVQAKSLDFSKNTGLNEIAFPPVQAGETSDEHSLQDRSQWTGAPSFEFQKTVSFESQSFQRVENSEIQALEREIEQLQSESMRLRPGQRRKRAQYAAQIQEQSTELAALRSKQNMSDSAAVAIDVIDYYSEHAHDYAQDTAPPRLDIHEGMQLVYAKMMANADDPQLNENMLALVAGVLEDPNAELSSADQRLLQEYGLVIRDGALQNFVTGEAVDAQDLADFAQIDAHQNDKLADIAATTGPRQDMLLRRGRASNLIVAAQLAERFLLDREQELTSALSGLRSSQKKLKENLSQGRNDLIRLQAQQQALQSRLDASSQLTQSLQGLQTAEDLSQFVLQATPAQQRQLRALGLDFEVQNGQVTFLQEGRTLEPADALRLLQDKAQAQSQALQREIELTQAALADTAQSVNDTEWALQDLEAQEQQVRQLQSEHATAFAEYEQRMAALKQLRDDPEAWNALSAEEQSEIEALLARHEEQSVRAQELQAEAQQELAATAALKQDARSFIEDAQASMERTQAVLEQAAQIGAELSQLLDRLKQQSQKLESSGSNEEVRALIEKANALASRLELAPSFEQFDVAELIQEWQKILKETQTIFSRWNKEGAVTQGIEERRMREYSERMLEQADYHLELIQSLTLKRSENLQQYFERHTRGLANGLQRSLPVSA